MEGELNISSEQSGWLEKY